MTCDNYTQWISAALDGELTAEQRRELDAHLAHCPDCAALYEMLSANSRAMREMECEFPEGLHDRIMNNLPPQEAPKQHKVIHWRRWGSLAACLVLVAAIGTLVSVVGIPMGANKASTAEMAEPRSETPMSPEAAPAENYEAHHSSKADDGEEASSAPESAAHGGFSNSVIPYSKIQYLRVGYGFTPPPSAAVISSATSLEEYLKGFGTNRFDGEGNPVPYEALEKLSDFYSDEFFADHCLVAVVVESGSGSTRYEVASVTADTVTIRTIVPEVGTCDMAAWLIVIELDEMLDDGSTLEVKFTF